MSPNRQLLLSLNLSPRYPFLRPSKRSQLEVLKKRDFMMIQDLIQQGVSQKDVAKQLGVHPKTVRRAVRRGCAP